MTPPAATVLAQKLSQIKGIGQVSIGGSSLPAVRVELNPQTLNKYGIGLETVRTALYPVVSEATLRQLVSALERNKVAEINPAAGARFGPGKV